MIDIKSPKTYTLADGLIKRTSSILDEIESKTVHKNQEVQAFTNCMHSYNHLCNVHANDVTHVQKFVHGIDSSSM